MRCMVDRCYLHLRPGGHQTGGLAGGLGGGRYPMGGTGLIGGGWHCLQGCCAGTQGWVQSQKRSTSGTRGAQHGQGGKRPGAMSGNTGMNIILR